MSGPVLFRRRAAALGAWLALGPFLGAANYWYNGTNITVPGNIVTAGNSVVYEALQTVQNQNQGQFEYNSGASGALIAGQQIRLNPGFRARAGSTVQAFIDANFNSISDYLESVDTDGDGYFDALEQFLGLDPQATSTSYSIDVNGDGAPDIIRDVVHAGTLSSYLPSRLNGYQNVLQSYYTAYGYYYSVYVNYGGGTIGGFFPSLSDYFNINFGVTYTYFDLVGWRYTTEFPTVAGRKYAIYTKGPGGWTALTNIIEGTGGWCQVFSPLYEYIWQFPQFVSVVQLGNVRKGQIALPGNAGSLSVGAAGLGGGTVSLGNGATATINPDGTATITVSGTTISVGANGNMSISGGPTLTLGSGATVTVQGATVNAGSVSVSAGIEFPDGTVITVDSSGTGGIVFSNGISISRGAGGMLDITLPPGMSPALGTAIDILEQVIQNGPNVSWSVRQVIGAVNSVFGPVIPLPSGGPLGSLDLGVTGAGEFQLGFKQGNDEWTWIDIIFSEPVLQVDANRNGAIMVGEASTRQAPYRFWINEDDDWGDVSGSDVPVVTNPAMNNGPADWQGDGGAYFGVDGVRDLVDFFPVFLDLKRTIDTLPSDTKYKLRQADGALNFVYSGLFRSNALKYQTQDLGAVFGPSFTSAVGQAGAHWITAEGVELSQEFLNRIENQGQGVILLEGRKSTFAPLVLAIEKADGTLIAEEKLELRISPVEQMYRHLNLRHGANAPSGLIGGTGDGHTAIGTAMGSRSAFPDEPGPEKWIFFIHGYNVSGEGARGWTSEVFKRFYWSGNRARFVGVTWFGNPRVGSANLNRVQGYHWAVRNALPTAQALAAQVNLLSGSKTVIGHSQGCWVAATAVADFNMSVANLCLIDAAFARECFDGSFAVDEINMVPTDWQSYPSRFWSTNWHQSFPNSDERSKLRWRDRLENALTRTTIHNFYSSTEDVLEKWPGTPIEAIVENAFQTAVTFSLGELGRYAWVVQEKAKGRMAVLSQGSKYGGWAPNLTDRPSGSSDPIYYTFAGEQQRVLQPPAALEATPTYRVRRAPIFDPGYSPNQGLAPIYDPSVLRGPDWIQTLYDTETDTTSGSAVAAINRHELLAEAIPAISLPLGANRSSALFNSRNYNMPEEYASPAWPRDEVEESGLPEWRHSDLREVAYVYLSGVFYRLVTISQ